MMVCQNNGVWHASSKHHQGTTMHHYAGIDVSVEESSVCVIDGSGKIVGEGKVPSERKALIAWLRDVGVEFTRVGLEAGPLSQWLFAGMQEAGLPVELLKTRRVRTAFKIMPVKTDRKHARGIAELMRLWVVPAGALQVHRGSGDACHADCTQTDAEAASRNRNEPARHSARLWPQGRQTTPRLFEGRIRELVAGHLIVEKIADALLSVRTTLWRQLDGFEKRLMEVARSDARTRLLMTTPGVGVIVALTFASAIDDPSRFTSSKSVGPHFD
jgi:transposase